MVKINFWSMLTVPGEWQNSIMNSKRLLMCAAGVALAFIVSACTPVTKRDQQLVAEPDPISLRLAQAVDKASAALQTLASIEQARSPGTAIQSVPYAPQELRRTVSIEWTGPVEPLARKLADRAGYQLQVNGDAPPTPVIVSVRASEKSVVEVLRDIGLQAGQRADVAIDPERRIVELNYAPLSGD
jgi:defect-in-organelle-trafficking protein DotD